MTDNIIEFRDFGFQYKAQQSPTLYDINFAVKKGEKVLIAGPSGCGKSTMVHCMNGLIPFSYNGTMTGSVTIAGKETKDASLFEISHTVGTVLQDSDAQFVGMTVAEDIAFALENDCIPQPEMKERVKQVAKMVNIGDFLSHAPSEVSGGQKQRVSVAGVLVDDVDVLLFDEPLANLDPATGKQAIELIDEMQKQTGAAVIIIEHRIEDVLHCPVDRVVLMNEGRIVVDTSSDKLLSGDYLERCGVREPLYVTALRYAGVEITPEKHPSNLETFALTDEEKEKVHQWFKEVPSAVQQPSADYMLQVAGVEFGYEKMMTSVLHDISVDVRRGEMLAIVGTNGAGKSTFSKVVCGFEEPTKGSITFCGEVFSTYSIKERAEHVGYVMQNPNAMISQVMIYDEVAFGLKNRGIPQDEIDRRVEEALRVCGLWRMRKWPISALSFGQKKRVTIASILVLGPEMIILDEPTAGQDYKHYTDIMEFLLELHAKGITIVMITHDMHLMLEYATRAVVFSHGRVIADDTPAHILTNPQIIEEASLKETSLYHLAMKCNLKDPTAFVQRFIDYERNTARHDESV
ncbi:energy-coupling factor transport system ATP-binding protein [Lachnospiraceae bacterium XBD2001]|nr:energy-coupling factor transport system ATP-binding protein [Lachnospiraceae bacterium XBD2001]